MIINEREFDLSFMPAVDGLLAAREYKQYVAGAMNKEEARAFIMGLLQYVSVVINGERVPLRTNAMIDNHIRTGTTLEEVMHALLRYNGIDPEFKAVEVYGKYLDEAGVRMADAFIARAESALSAFLAESQASEQ